MSNFQLSIIAGLVAWVWLCWMAAKFVGMATDERELDADARIDSIKAILRPTVDGVTEARATDFGDVK